MDRSKFFWLISRYKTIDNPTSLDKVDRVIDVLQLGTDSRVLDIASGKAEMLCRIASKYGSRCVGVERSLYFCEEAIERNDTHFYVGTVHGNPFNWVIVGLFYPPKTAAEQQVLL